MRNSCYMFDDTEERLPWHEILCCGLRQRGVKYGTHVVRPMHSVAAAGFMLQTDVQRFSFPLGHPPHPTPLSSPGSLEQAKEKLREIKKAAKAAAAAKGVATGAGSASNGGGANGTASASGGGANGTAAVDSDDDDSDVAGGGETAFDETCNRQE